MYIDIAYCSVRSQHMLFLPRQRKQTAIQNSAFEYEHALESMQFSDRTWFRAHTQAASNMVDCKAAELVSPNEEGAKGSAGGGLSLCRSRPSSRPHTVCAGQMPVSKQCGAFLG
jgi:hypothetical protein